MRLLKEVRNLTGSYHVKSGMYHYFRCEYRQAEEFFRKALKDASGLSHTDLHNARHYLTLSIMDLAERQEARGELEQAVEHLCRASQVSEDFPDIHFRLGRLYEELDRTEEAIAAYERAIECHADYLEAQVALGFCLLRGGRAEPAAEAFERARQLKVARIEEPHLRALELLRRGEAGEAADLFHEAYLAAPQLAQEFRHKGLDLLREEEFEAALQAFDRAVQLCPKYPDLHNFRGIVLHELERMDEAIEAFRLSAGLGPGYRVPRLNLAFALIAAGEIREAEAQLETILEEDPTEPAATARLAELREGRVPEKRRKTSRGNAR